MNRLSRYSIDHPFRVLLISLLLTAALAPGILRLRLRTDGFALIPTHAPAVEADRAVRETFGVGDEIVVLVRSRRPEGIFDVHTLALIRDLTAAIRGIDGLGPANVSSLATEPSDRYRPGTLAFYPLLEPFPRSPEDLARLRSDLEAIRLYTGTLVSRDGSAAAILVRTPERIDHLELCARIRALIRGRADESEEIRLIGAPVAEALLGTHILEDLGIPAAWLGTETGAGRTAPPDAGALYRLRVLIANRIGLVPIALLVMALVFLLSFRSLVAVGLPLFEVAAALAAVFGLMGWLGVPVYLTIAVLPVILTAIAVADEIHIFARYAQERRSVPAGSPTEAIRTTMEEMAGPVVKTSITTAIGFCSFALSPIRPVAAFGIFTAFGVLFCMFWSLAAIPASLAILRPPGFRVAGRRRFDPAPVLGSRPSGARRTRRRLGALGLAVLLLVAVPMGIARLRIQDSWIDGFAPESEFYRATRFFNGQFYGSHILRVLVDAGRTQLTARVPATDVGHHEVRFPADLVSDPKTLEGCLLVVRREEADEPVDPIEAGKIIRNRWSSRIETAERTADAIRVTMPLHDGSPVFSMRPEPKETLVCEIESERLTVPSVLARIERFQSFVESRRDLKVGGTLGPPNYLATTNYIVKRRAEDQRKVPDDPDRVRWLWEQYGRIRGVERLRQAVDEDYRRGLVEIFLNDANFIDTAKLMQEIRGYERDHLAPEGIHLSFAGDVAVSQTLIRAIVSTQIRSLLLSLVGVVLAASLLSRSLRWGALSVVPSALAVAVGFAVMGWAGIPLGVATTMFAGMTFGLGVDYAIHMIERYRLARSRGVERDAAVSDALANAGPAILIDGSVVALGFGVLILSQVPANSRLGLLTVITVVSCLAGTFLLIPAILRAGSTRDAAGPAGADGDE